MNIIYNTKKLKLTGRKKHTLRIIDFFSGLIPIKNNIFNTQHV